MLDLAWSEIALVAVVALVVIGPKDLPEAVRGVAKGIQKLRRMVGEFQQQADELVREAKLDDVRNQIAEVRSTISDIRRFDIKGEIEKAVDSDGSVRKAFADDPLKGGSSSPTSSYLPPDPYSPEVQAAAANAPSFIPPEHAKAAAPYVVTPPPAPEPAPLAEPLPPAAEAAEPPPAAEPTPAAAPPPAAETLPAAATEPAPAAETLPAAATEPAPAAAAERTESKPASPPGPTTPSV